MTTTHHIDLDFPRLFIDPDAIIVDGHIDTPLVQHLPDLTPDSPPHVALHITSAGTPQFEFWRSSLSFARTDRAKLEVVAYCGGPYMDRNRNLLTYRTVKDTQAPWMLCLDDDLGHFGIDEILELVSWATAHNIHVAGGVYASPHDGQNYCVAYDHIDGAYQDLTVEQVDAMDPDDPNACQVAAIGTGFLLVHRSVLELMPLVFPPPQPWFAEAAFLSDNANDEEKAVGVHLGEDLTFCARLNSVGIPVHVAPHVRLTHFKKVGITLPPHPSRLSS